VLYSEWLTIFDIARLDSATCNRQQRSSFTALAYTSCRALQYPTEIIGDTLLDAMSIWICRKDVPVAGLFLTPTIVLNDTLRLDYLKRRGQQLQWITYKQIIGKTVRSKQSEGSLGVEAYCPNLTRLRAINWDGGPAVTKIIASSHHLTELRLRGEITNKQIQELVGKCNNLRKLTIHAMQNKHDGVFNALISTCPHLEEVNFSMQGYLTDSLVDKLMRKCPELSVLALNNAILSFSTLIALLGQCGKMRTLSLDNSELFENTSTTVFKSALTELCFNTVTVDDADILFILQCCPALQTLALTMRTATAHVFMNIGPLCRHLQRLDISDNAESSVNNAVLHILSEHCTQLRMLNVTGTQRVPDGGICAVVRACPLLQELHLPVCSTDLTDVSLLIIGQYSVHLTLLELQVLESNKQLTDAGVTAVLQGCPKLKHLKFPNFRLCEGLSKEMWVVLAEKERRQRRKGLALV
jgi:hypothetical protein